MRNWRFLKFITGVVIAAFLASTVPVAALGVSVAGTTQDAQTVLNNDDVLQMVAANLSEGLILSQIRSFRTAFDLSVPEIIRLSKDVKGAGYRCSRKNSHGFFAYYGKHLLPATAKLLG